MTAAVHIAELCRLYVLVTLVAAVVGKANAIGPFIAATAELLGLSTRAAAPVAYAVIAAEASAALLLLAGGAAALIGMWAALLLFAAFTFVLAVAVARRRNIRCNCFGGRGHRVGAYDLVRNATLIVSGILFLSARARDLPGSPGYFALQLGAALILFLVFANLREILALARQD